MKRKKNLVSQYLQDKQATKEKLSNLRPVERNKALEILKHMITAIDVKEIVKAKTQQ